MAGPTNSDIMREIKGINQTLIDHEGRIKPLEQFKIAYDAADAAITKYRSEHPETKANVVSGINKEFLKVIGQVVALFGSLLALLYLVVETMLAK